MRNVELMTKVKELATQTLFSREQSSRVMVQIAVIRQAFGVKNDEHEKPVRDYERKLFLSNEEIKKQFKMYLDFLSWAIQINDIDKQREFKNQIDYFIDGVRFFNGDLADEFELTVIQGV